MTAPQWLVILLCLAAIALAVAVSLSRVFG